MTSELRESIGQLINDCERRIDHLEKAISSPALCSPSMTRGMTSTDATRHMHETEAITIIIENRRFILRLQAITKRERERRDDLPIDDPQGRA